MVRSRSSVLERIRPAERVKRGSSKKRAFLLKAYQRRFGRFPINKLQAMGNSVMITTGMIIGGIGTGAMKLTQRLAMMKAMIFELYVLRNGEEWRKVYLLMFQLI